MWRENVLAHAHPWRGSTQIENRILESQDGKYKILNCIERHKFCLSDFLTNSNRTTLQSHKVEERTYGTPCICLQITDIFRFKNRATIRH